MTRQEALLVLNAIPGISGSVIRKLCEIFGSSENVLYKTEEDLLEQGFNPNLVRNIHHFPKDKFLQDEYSHLQRLGLEFITIIDDDYPSLLKDITHAPLVLYTKGNKSLLHSTGIALVGAREASSYGLKIAEEFAYFIAQAGITVVSGGAYGIDTVSHKGALKAKGPTVAVLGCGMDHLYPKENTRLFEEIAQQGLLVSEFPINTAPLSYNFPRRNRIISGLTLATVVIEAKERSGALITSDFALEQNREVFAVPGNINNAYSKGTNRLIKDGGKMVLSAQDLLEELGLAIGLQLNQESNKNDAAVHLSEDEYKIYELINHMPQHIDIISSSSGQGVGIVTGQMLNLELKGVIKQLPGQYYIRA